MATYMSSKKVLFVKIIKKNVRSGLEISVFFSLPEEIPRGFLSGFWCEI